MKFQVIQRNDYGNTNIMGQSNDIEGAVKIAKQLVTEDNMENALTLADKLIDFESYYVEVLDEGVPTTQAVYGGKERGKDFLYCFDDGEPKKIFLDTINMEAGSMRFFIGKDNKKELFAGNPSRKRPGEFDEISDMKDRGLMDKMVYYIQVIR